MDVVDLCSLVVGSRSPTVCLWPRCGTSVYRSLAWFCRVCILGVVDVGVLLPIVRVVNVLILCCSKSMERHSCC